MNKKLKVVFITERLEELYSDPPIPLCHSNKYTLLIAVLLSAQCTDERVNKVTPDLFKLADSPEKMICLSEDRVRDIIRPCGLSPKKSKAIIGLSKILVDKYNCVVPSKLEDLEDLPGVGHKTASVVLSQAFNIPTFPVDTHIHRLCYRWGLSSGKNVVQTEKDCKRLFLKRIWSKLHLQMIYFGREYCPARGHDPYRCPICSIVGRKSIFN
tara:strand:+ start:371 stop:1006 length:636 start_codon:yes stop_codon:yes gene_type:complete